MKFSELLAKEIDPARIQSAYLRNEVSAFLELARVGLGLEVRPEWRDEYLRNKVPLQEPLVSSLLFLDVPYLNAFAFKTNASSAIAITVGTPLITRAIFVAAFADDHILNDLPDVHYLRKPYKSLTDFDWERLIDLISAFSLKEFEIWAQSSPTLPQSADRSGRGDLAIILSLQAWSFIVFHELGHHAMQHLVTPAGSSLALPYMEIEQLETVGVHSSGVEPGQVAHLPEALLLRHANELEADRYAIAKMYHSFFRSHPAIRINSANYKAMTTMSERSRTRLWLVTIGIVFLLFEASSRGRAGNTHPRPLFRLQHLLEFTRVQADAIAPGGSTEEFESGYVDATGDLTRIARNLGIHNPYAVQPDDAAYKDRMMAIRSSHARRFEPGL